MTTPVHADPRRRDGGQRLSFAPALGAGSALELPVLFQLSDLSHARILSPARPKPDTKAAPQQAASPASAETETKTAVQEPSAASAEISPAETSGGISSSSTEASPPPPADSPTIRERAQMRQRRQQAAAKGDWFQTQGKYILVVFLLGLIVTIFVARGKDDSPQSPVRQPIESRLAVEAETPADDRRPAVEPPSMAEQMDITPAEGPPAIATAESSSDPLADVNPAHGADSLSEFVEPPTPGVATDGPQVTLQAPQASAPSPAPPSAAAPSDESLFTFSSEPRVASRPQPEPSRTDAPLPQANPHFPGPTAATPPSGETDAAPGGYPVTDPSTYRGYRSPSPPPPPAPSGAAPASYERRVPTAPRPSGPRYERTGSGLY